MEKEFAAYLAGLVDGEGYIGLSRVKTGSRIARMEIKMTTPELVGIRDQVGLGSIAFRKSKHDSWKDTYYWNMNANACRYVLPHLLPWMRVKKQQAELLLEYLSLARRGRKRVPRQAEIADAMYKLNARGAKKKIQ